MWVVLFAVRVSVKGSCSWWHTLGGGNKFEETESDRWSCQFIVSNGILWCYWLVWTETESFTLPAVSFPWTWIATCDENIFRGPRLVCTQVKIGIATAQLFSGRITFDHIWSHLKSVFWAFQFDSGAVATNFSAGSCWRCRPWSIEQARSNDRDAEKFAKQLLAEYGQYPRWLKLLTESWIWRELLRFAQWWTKRVFMANTISSTFPLILGCSKGHVALHHGRPLEFCS